ncbi:MULTISPECIES: hypothetical protein [unclassified Clostridioides]|uniref:hypothetical protein n=1 Tax=unclassified Clostridioides TaxID=2635829 RepID=UPI001D102A9D
MDLKYRISIAELLLKRGKIKESENIDYNTEIRMDFSYISFYEMNGELPKEYTFRLYALKKFLKCEKYAFKTSYRVGGSNSKIITIVGGKRVIQKIPEYKLLVETDAPFIRAINHCHEIYENLNQTIIGISNLKNHNLSRVI